MYDYSARVVSIHDGDTVHVDVDLGCDVHVWLTIRLMGINAPELHSPDGIAARDFLAAQLGMLPAPIELKTIKDRREKYGRYLGYLIAGGVNLNDLMVTTGHAVAYLP